MLFGNIFNSFDDRLGRDAMLLVVGFLNSPTAIRFVDGGFHSVCHFIGVQDNVSVDVTCGATDGLNKGVA